MNRRGPNLAIDVVTEEVEESVLSILNLDTSEAAEQPTHGQYTTADSGERLGDIEFARWRAEMKRLLDDSLSRKLAEVGLSVPKSTSHASGLNGRPDGGLRRGASAITLSRAQTKKSLEEDPTSILSHAEQLQPPVRKPFRSWTAKRAARSKSQMSITSVTSGGPGVGMQDWFRARSQTADFSDMAEDKSGFTMHRGNSRVMCQRSNSKASDQSEYDSPPSPSPRTRPKEGQIRSFLPGVVPSQAPNMVSVSESTLNRDDTLRGGFPRHCNFPKSGTVSNLHGGMESRMPAVRSDGPRVPLRVMLTKNHLSRNMPERLRSAPYVKVLAASAVLNPKFDWAICALIILNAITMGIQADYTLRTGSNDVPMVFDVIERVYAILFTSELVLRFTVFGCSFFWMPGRYWNIFDFLVVATQWFEEIMASFSGQNMSFIGVLRLLRLVRVIRLARILRLIRELRVLVTSITNSMKSLVWTVMLMLLMIYSVSLCITQVVSDYRTALVAKDQDMSDELVVYYGSLLRCMLSLFEAITSGADWDNLISPLLMQVSPWLSVLFLIYIAVATLAIMNVVTGVFVDSVLASAKSDKEQFLLNNARSLFKTNDEEMDWDTFNSKMDNPQMLEFFKGIDVDPSEAKGIFNLIDVDESGSITADEFLNSCVRLQGPSKALETAVLLQEVKLLRKHMAQLNMEAHFMPSLHS